ncbi:MAG: hypothetical protein LUC37_02165 [Prevotella sp.]|nr:hypothetical protein [Prevotella sp.]
MKNSLRSFPKYPSPEGVGLRSEQPLMMSIRKNFEYYYIIVKIDPKDSKQVKINFFDNENNFVTSYLVEWDKNRTLIDIVKAVCARYDKSIRLTQIDKFVSWNPKGKEATTIHYL